MACASLDGLGNAPEYVHIHVHIHDRGKVFTVVFNRVANMSLQTLQNQVREPPGKIVHQVSPKSALRTPKMVRKTVDMVLFFAAFGILYVLLT